MSLNQVVSSLPNIGGKFIETNSVAALNSEHDPFLRGLKAMSWRYGKSTRNKYIYYI
jgi:hypothetical protein